MLTSPDAYAAAEAILRLALHDPDGPWVAHRALELLHNPDAGIRAAAATALGHIARIHRTIDTERVIQALQHLTNNPATAGQAQDALDDVAMFATRNQS